jgi:hypothetical protein
MTMPGDADGRVTAAFRLGALAAALGASTSGLSACSLITSWTGYAGDGDGGSGDAQTDSGARDDAEDAIADTSSDGASDGSGGDVTAGDAAKDTGSTGSDAATDGSAAPITFVQVASDTSSGSATTASATFSQAQGAADLIVLVVGWVGGAVPITQVSDSVGNGYATAFGPTRISAGISQSIYYAKGIAAAPAGTNTVTVTLGAAVNPLDLRALEYAGLDPVAPLDTAAGFGGRNTSADSTPVTTGTPRELVFGAGITLGSFTGAGAAFTLRKLTSTTFNLGVVEDRVVSSTGSYSADAPLASNASYVMQVATFR